MRSVKPPSDRSMHLAAALKTNLRRRKTQARDRQALMQKTEAADTASADPLLETPHAEWEPKSRSD